MLGAFVALNLSETTMATCQSAHVIVNLLPKFYIAVFIARHDDETAVAVLLWLQFQFLSHNRKIQPKRVSKQNLIPGADILCLCARGKARGSDLYGIPGYC